MTQNDIAVAFLIRLQSVAMCFATLCKSLQNCSKTQKDHGKCIIKSLTGTRLQHAWLAKALFANWPGRKGSVCKLAGPQQICLQTGRAATDLFRTGWSCNTRVSASQQECFRPQKHSRCSTNHREAIALCACVCAWAGGRTGVS